LEAHRVERKLSAIFAADVEGYSRLMGQDEVDTLRTLTAYRVVIDRLIVSHRGRIFNTAGDSVLADFASAVEAVQCAVEVQDAITKENADLPAGDQMRFRMAYMSATSSFRATTCLAMPSMSRPAWRLLRNRAGSVSRVLCRSISGQSWLSGSSISALSR
jgi:class 3 adenylate cyclase